MDVFPSLDCSSSVINHQEEDDDDWVVVKKQKILILIPPPSPTSQQTVKVTSPESAKQSKSVKHSSIVTKEKTSGHRRRTCYRLHVDGSGQVDPKPKLQQPESSFHDFGIGHVGTVKVVNRKIRAMNLESKLRSLGGMRKWLSLLGLDRFAEFLEMKKVDQHQLVNLSTSKLKGMGMNAVGPRRKLIHAIDLLCQPYYCSQGF